MSEKGYVCNDCSAAVSTVFECLECWRYKCAACMDAACLTCKACERGDDDDDD